MKLSRRSFLYGAGPVFWAQPALGAVKAIRFAENPIIRPDMPTVGNDINGPSLVSVPKWLANPLGRYYLYFAGHRGTYIRLAYADAMKGPWRIYEQGVLRLKDTVCHGHIASPDVHVDDAARQVRLYFHGPITDKPNPQRTFLAVSQEGQQFTASPEVLGLDYLRVFRWGEPLLLWDFEWRETPAVEESGSAVRARADCFHNGRRDESGM